MRSYGSNFIAFQAAIRFRCHPFGHDVLKGRNLHEADENALVLIHALDEQILQQPLEPQLEFVARLNRRRLSHPVVGHYRFDSLVEKELIRLAEIRAESLVQSVDKLGKRYRLRAHHAAANLRWPVERPGLPFLKRNGPLADLLQAVIFKSYFVIEPIRRPTLAARQLRLLAEFGHAA